MNTTEAPSDCFFIPKKEAEKQTAQYTPVLLSTAKGMAKAGNNKDTKDLNNHLEQFRSGIVVAYPPKGRRKFCINVNRICLIILIFSSYWGLVLG